LTSAARHVLFLFMSNPGDTAAEQALLLELAQLGLGMARQLHDATLATTDPDVLIPLATAYSKVGRGVRQCLALRARFAAGTVVTERSARAETASRPERQPGVERADWTERPDWNERFDLERLDGHPDAFRARIARNLTIVSRTPALAAIPALRAPAAHLAGRAALLAGATLRLVNSS
jgi:hypothetical protein